MLGDTMSISLVQRLAVGNALRVFLQPPATALRWRLLRKETDDFTGPSDPGAYLVRESDDKAILDAKLLDNGVTYYYRAYYWDGAAWAASSSVSAVPSADYEDASTDVPQVVRDRLAYGLAVEVAAARMHPQYGVVSVLSAPPVFEDVQWPVVTVHLQSEEPSVRGIGEEIDYGDVDPLDADLDSTEGWLARVQLAVIGWSQNPDERAELRRALRRVVIANLGVFDDTGMVQIDFQMQDIDMLTEFPAPVYQVMCSFTCLAPARVVVSRDQAVASVPVTIIED